MTAPPIRSIRDIRILFALTLLASGLNSTAFGQTPRFEGRRVATVQYDPPEQPLAKADLDRVQMLREGSDYQASEVAESINRMFATGRYEDIQVDVEESANGLLVRFITKAARFIGHIGAVGKISSPPNRAQIVNAAELDLGAEFHPDALAVAQKNIEQLLTSNGLYEATAHIETVDDPVAQQVKVNIVVNDGRRAHYELPTVHGETKLPDETIVRATGWRLRFIGRWRQVTRALTREGVERVKKKYQSQDRLAASVDLKSLDYDPKTGRAQPALEIDAGPKIHVKAVEAKISKGRLKRYVPIYREGAVDEDLLVEGARNLRDYFQSQGYTDVDVTFRRDPPTNDEQTIEYFISRGARQKLVFIDIRGNRYFDRKTLRERMFLQPSAFRRRWGRYSEGFLTKDEETIASLYKSNGFRDIRVTSAVETDYRGKPDQIAVAINIDEGPQWLIAHLEIAGLEALNKKVILQSLSSEEGQPYSDLNVAEDRNRILTACYANGYPHARFKSAETPAGPHQVNLRYEVTMGRREFVRQPLISGLTNTRLSLVKENLKIKPGDPLSSDEIRQTQRQLYNLGVFSKIDSAVQNPNGQETEKYVLYDFEEASRYSLNVGIGAELAQFGATTTNLSEPTGATGFSPRLSVDVDRLNFLGLGHTIALQTRISNLEQRAGLSYLFPKLNNVEGRSLTITGLYDLTRDVLTFSSRREEASVQLSQKFSRSITGTVRFAYRRVNTTNIVIPALLVPQLLQPVRIGILSGSLVQDHRDNPADAHKGMYNSIDVGLASNVFGSQRDFARILARNATYYRLTRNLVLARQVTFGAILPFRVPAGVTAADAVPLPERFFGGGNISDRGFPENQAGPRDIGSPAGPGATASQPTGFPLGGNSLLFFNTELRFPLLGENIGGVLFHDAGNVYDRIGDISFRFHQRNNQDFDYMVHAVGFGLRYKTPIGPVRADLAYSINPPHFVGFNGTFQQLLSCNPNLPLSQLPAVCSPVAQSVSHFQFFFSIGQTF
jgi:outer membrane protein insertion porin family